MNTYDDDIFEDDVDPEETIFSDNILPGESRAQRRRKFLMLFGISVGLLGFILILVALMNDGSGTSTPLFASSSESVAREWLDARFQEDDYRLLRLSCDGSHNELRADILLRKISNLFGARSFENRITVTDVTSRDYPMRSTRRFVQADGTIYSEVLTLPFKIEFQETYRMEYDAADHTWKWCGFIDGHRNYNVVQ